MRKLLLVIVLVSCVSICFAQGNSFDDFKKLFKKVELPLVTDSCSIRDLVYQDLKYHKISKRMKKYIPEKLYEELFKEQSVRAYFNLPVSEKYVSLILYAGTIEDDFIITNSVLYLVNYDNEGHVIDYIKVAGCLFESGHSWCKIDQHNIWYNSYEECPVTFEYEVRKVIPMIESRLKYSIGTDGHFSKEEVLFYRKGIYEPTYNGCMFEFRKSFPGE